MTKITLHSFRQQAASHYHLLKEVLSRRREVALRLTVATVLLFSSQQILFQKVFAQQQQQPETIYNIDWEEHLTPAQGLKAHDENLLGDHIDPATGGLSFEQVDVSIPGNSGLPVEIRRRRNPGQSFNNEFADWQLAVPTISTKINATEFTSGTRWGKNRCTQPLVSSIPNSDFAKVYFHDLGGPVYPQQYSDGVLLDVPGRASSHLLDKTVSGSWPANAQKVTVDGWYFTCLTNIDGAGTEGFYGYAPNGERYRFDVIRSRNAVAKNDTWHIDYTSLGGQSLYHVETVYYDVLAASEVVDVNGNWVHYNYDSAGKLTSITSNDGRQMDVNYDTAGRVSSVVAHPGTTDQRTWSYTYGNQSAYQYLAPFEPDGVPGSGYQAYTVLKTVVLPNSRQWQFNLAGLFAKSVPGTTYNTLSGGVPVTCKQLDQTVSVTHPDGIVGEFELKEYARLYPIAAQSQYGPPCPNSSLGRGTNYYADFMAVTKKTLSAPTVPTAVWQYDYVNANAPFLGQYGANRTVVTLPDGSMHINHYAPSSNHSSILKEQVFTDTTATTLLQTTDYTYLQEGSAGSDFVAATVTADVYKPLRRQQITITRNSDQYNTVHTYVTDRNAANYSYGYPVRTETWSSLGGGTRVTDYTWLKDQDDWILGQLNTVTRNGDLFDDYDYDTKGRLVTHKRFGVTVATLGYYTSGVQAGRLNWYKDALARQTTYSDYYRGAPRTITRADATAVTRAIDRNGRVTSHTNARGFQTHYQYDPVGRLMLIDRPETWSDTTIGYAYSSSGLVQTATQGTETTKTTYDAMLRPIQVHREDLLQGRGLLPPSNYHIYTETAYDAMGRVRFVSLPSDTAGSTIGTETDYDALGRVTQTRETAQGGGTTYYAYLPGNQTQVTDPMGNVTTTTASGYGSPGDGSPITVDKPEGVSADFSYDIYGNLLSIAQAKGGGLMHVSNFVYDSRYRLCRRSVPETGDILYAYNNANEMTAYAEGQLAGSSCATPPAATAVNLTYDALGRLKTTNYPSPTPDIVRSYDANGNLIAIDRDGINWDYSYNAIDLIDDETLTVDGRSYGIDYGYDNSGFLTSKTYPSGRQYLYSNDGLGRLLTVDANGTRHVQLDSYHPNGKIAFMYLGQGGNYYSQSLNPRQLVASIGGYPGDNRTYSYDANGRVVQINSTAYSAYDRTFDYDGAGRLISASGPWGTGSYSYDPLGNLTQKTLGSRVVDIEYNSLNRVSRVRDSAASNNWRNYSYDARGNTTADGMHGFSYDFANQPVTISGPGSSTWVLIGLDGLLIPVAVDGSNRYDGNLKRVKEVVGGQTIYSIYDKSGTLVTRDNATSGDVTDYVQVAGQNFVRITNGVAYYQQPDHLGTSILEADNAANVPASRVYNNTPFGENIAPPFGNPDNDPGNRHEVGFTGHVEDATGLVYMQARYYDPVIGRFLSPDPIGYKDQLNVYAYVHNDPVNYSDPTGMYLEAAFEAASLAIGVKSFADDVSNGNFSAAVVDGLGVVADVVLAAVPFAPGVVGMTIQTGRVTDDVVESVAEAAFSGNKPITMDTAVELGATHVDNAGDMITTGKGTNYQFTNTTTDTAGNTVTNNARFDVNPADPHVQKNGAHLNLETHVNGKIVRNDHISIDPSTVRPGDIPPPPPKDRR